MKSETRHGTVTPAVDDELTNEQARRISSLTNALIHDCSPIAGAVGALLVVAYERAEDEGLAITVVGSYREAARVDLRGIFADRLRSMADTLDKHGQTEPGDINEGLTGDVPS